MAIVSASPVPAGPAVGTVFPDITLPDQHGRPLTLGAYRAGAAALVVVFRSTRW